MRTHSGEVRCKNCNILLGKLDKVGFTVRRGEIEVHYTGCGVVSIRCYRTRCRALNVLRIVTESQLKDATE